MEFFRIFIFRILFVSFIIMKFIFKLLVLRNLKGSFIEDDLRGFVRGGEDLVWLSDFLS